MKPSEKILIIDGNNLFYRAYYSHGRLTGLDGKNISAIYGGLNIISAALRKFNLAEVVVCWDGSRSKHRLKLWPTYKQGRTQKLPSELEDMDRQKKIFRTLIDMLGIAQIVNPDHEADDLIYALARRKRSKLPVIVMSTDKDFDQMVRSNVFLWNDKVGKMITPKNIKTLKGYNANQCVDYLVLTGDSGDNIPGYGGIGEKTAHKILEEHKSLEEYIKYINREHGGQKGKIIATQLISVRERNRFLIDLKYFYEQVLNRELKFKYFSSKKVPYREKEYIKLAASLGLRKYREETFLKLFRK